MNQKPSTQLIASPRSCQLAPSPWHFLRSSRATDRVAFVHWCPFALFSQRLDAGYFVFPVSGLYRYGC